MKLEAAAGPVFRFVRSTLGFAIATAAAGRRPSAPMMALLIAFSAALLTASTGPARSQVGVTHTWVAKVDEEWITRHDVEERAKLLRFERRETSLKQARKKAREELIDEALQIQEIKKLKVQASKEDVKAQVERIAKSTRSTTAQLYKKLQAAGISPSALEHRVKVQLGWSNVLRKRHGSKIVPSDEEIAQRLKRAPKTPEGPTVYRVGQVLVDAPRNALPLQLAVAFQQAEKARKEYSSCDVTQKVAKKYSRVFPGRVGETIKSRMPEPLQKVILPLKPGETTKPLRTPNGFMIFRLCDRKKIGGRKLKPEEVKRVLFEEKVSRYTQLELNDMRRDALIELAQ